MTAGFSSRSGSLAPGLALRLDPVCDRFEAAWLAGVRPHLKDYLPLVEEADRPLLLRELLEVELYYRRRLGEDPTAQEYRLTLPEHAKVVEALLGAQETAQPQTSGSCRQKRSGRKEQEAADQDLEFGDPTSSLLRTSATGRLVLGQEIARGGMGAVLLGRDEELGRAVAVKILLEGHASRPEMLRRFVEEARIAGQLQHPGVVPIYDLGVLPDRRPYFTMKLVQGQTLARLLAARADLAPERSHFLTIFTQVCQAVAYAHDQQVVHRDLKPANIMVGAFGEVQVMDWGLAKVLREGTNCTIDGSGAIATQGKGCGAQTQSGSLMGTPAYMAPEQARGEVEQIDQRADVFGLGAILCEILTGRPPFTGTATEALAKAKQGQLDDAQARLAACGAEAEMVDLAHQCLAAEPRERPRDAGVLAQAMTSYQNSVAERLRQAEQARAAEEARAKEAQATAAQEKKAREAAQAHAAAERRARRLLVSLAIAVLVLVLGTGSGIWILEQQQATALAHQLMTDREAIQLLEQARGRLEEGWLAQDWSKLAEARAEGNRAAAVARSGGASAAVQERAATFQVEAEERLGQVQKNDALRGALLDVSNPHETATYKSQESGRMVAVAQLPVDEQYAGAIRRWGLDVDSVPEAEVVARLQAQPEVVVRDLLAGLTSWMLDRYWHNRPEAGWRRLFRLTDQMDGSELRRRLRTLLVKDTCSIEEAVAWVLSVPTTWPTLPILLQSRNQNRWQELRGQIDPRTEPVVTLVLLTQVSTAMGDDAGAEALLRQALATRPDQVTLLNALGKLLERQGPARLGEAVGCYRAARARRPGLGISLGRALQELGQVAEAEAVFRDLVRQQPDNPEYHFFLGNNLYQQQRLSDTATAYRKAIDLAPDGVAAHLNLGNVLLLQGKLDQAITAYCKGIDVKPDLAEGYCGLGIALLQQIKLDEAVMALRKAIALKPGLSSAYSSLGQALCCQGKLDEAVAACRKGIAFDPGNALAFYQLGAALRKQQNFVEAEAAFHKAIELNPEDAEAFAALGCVLEDQGELPGAVTAYRKAIALKPNFAMVYSNLGNALRQQGELKEAEAACRKAIALDPRDAGAYLNLGSTLCEQRRLEEGIVAYRKAIALDPELARAHSGLGCALQAQGKLEEAVPTLRKAIELNPNDFAGYQTFGTVLVLQGKLDEAVAASRKAITLKPDCADAYNCLGAALGQMGRLDDAIAAYHKAIAIKPDLAGAYSNLGGALMQQEKVDEAIIAYRKAIALKPELAQPRILLGIALMQRAQFKEALDALKEGENLLPAQHPLREHVRQTVEQCQRQLALDSRLPAILQGKDKSVSTTEQLELGALCYLKNLYAAAARFYRDGLTADSHAADAAGSGVRYNAACAAAMAGCGWGKDADKLDDAVRAQWRRQAHDWLRAELSAWAKALQEGKIENSILAQHLERWQTDKDLAGVRDKEALDKFPEQERKQWFQLWSDFSLLKKKTNAVR